MPLNGFSYFVSWSDFNQQVSAPSADENAQIHPDISFNNFRLTRIRNAVSIREVDVNITLVPNDCWVVSSRMAADLLEHEQGHYDIIAISAREFYNALIGLPAASVSALQTRVTQLQTRLQQTASSADRRYDTETNHGRNVQAQQQWNQKIGAEKQRPNGSLLNL